MKIIKNNRPRYKTAEITCDRSDCKSVLEVNFYDILWSTSKRKGSWRHFNCAVCGNEITVWDEDDKMFKPLPAQ